MNIKGLIFFGDSVLAGAGASERDLCCAKLIKKALKMPVSLKARNWNTSVDGIERLDNDVIGQTQYSHVIILFGNNDSWLIGPQKSKVDLDVFERNMKEIMLKIINNNQIPLICNLQMINHEDLAKHFHELDDYRKGMNMTAEEIHSKYNAIIEKLVSEMQCQLIDIRSKLKHAKNNTVAMDGIHPNDEGHRIIAERILQCLRTIDPVLENVDSIN